MALQELGAAVAVSSARVESPSEVRVYTVNRTPGTWPLAAALERVQNRRRDSGGSVSGYGDTARVYDGEYGGMTADVDFYLRTLADEGVRGPVLELGCGTGRVAVPLATAGHRVTGVDLSEAMLRRARRRRRSLPPEVAIRLRFSRQDMRSFAFPRRFSACVVAFSTFNLLPTADDRRQCVQRLAVALEPGAPLVFDLAAPRTRPCGPSAASSTFVLPGTGQVVEKVVEQRPLPGRNAFWVRYEYRVRRFADGEVVDRFEVVFELAKVERPEVESALYAAGFDVEAVEGDYRGTRFRPEHARMVVRARRLS